MKKAIIFSLLALILIVVGAFVYAVQNANSLVASYKPALEEVASKGLGTPVRLGNLKVSVFPKTGVVVDKFTLGGKDGLSLNNLNLALELMPLLSKKLHISKILLDKPELTFIADNDGVNIKGLPKSKSTATKKPAAQKKASAESNASAPAAVPDDLGLQLDSFEIRNANIVYEDRVADKKQTISDLNLDVGLDFARNKLTVPGLSLSANTSMLGPLSLKGKNLGVDLKNTGVTIPELILNLGGRDINIAALLGLNNNLAKLDELLITAFEGNLKGSADYNITSSAFSFNTAGEGMKLGEAASAFTKGADSPVAGVLKSISLDLKGAVAGLPNSINGLANLKVINGMLKGSNIPGDVLRAIDGIPGVSGSLMENAPPEERKAIEGTDTTFEEMTLETSLGNGVVRIAKFYLFSNTFSLSANGTLGFNGAIDMDSSVIFNRVFSEALSLKVKELNSLRDNQGRLAFPVRLKGNPTSIKVLPDMKKILKAATKGAIREKATELINKKLGGKDGDSPITKGLGKVLGW